MIKVNAEIMRFLEKATSFELRCHFFVVSPAIRVRRTLRQGEDHVELFNGEYEARGSKGEHGI
jgi:hypothetical protein